MKSNIFITNDRKYWKSLYNEPEFMDGIFNAKQHCLYMRGLFELELIHINRIVEFGCGYGHILKNLISTFHPTTIEVVEPSRSAIELAKKRIKKTNTSKIKFHQSTIQNWCKKQSTSKKIYDLAVCNSVFQYIPSNQLPRVISLLSKKFRYSSAVIKLDASSATEILTLAIHPLV